MNSLAPTAGAALSVRGLTIMRGKVLVLEDVSFSAQPGALTAILGDAGAGKTSLLAGIAGLLKLERGAVLVGGLDVGRSRPSRRGVGLLPPGTDLGSDLTLDAALRRIARKHGGARDELGAQAHAASIIQALGLSGAADTRLAEFSHGLGYAAIAAARLLVHGKAGLNPVMLVDEAGAGLTEAASDALIGLLQEQAAGGRTVLMATRSRNMASAADYLVLLHEGRVVQAGTPGTLYAEPRNAVAANLTGGANFLRGTLRQKVPGGFVWVAAGGRFTQCDMPGQPAPLLGSEMVFCLRPELLVVNAPAEMPNRIGAVVQRMVRRSGSLDTWFDTALGVLRATVGPGSSLRAGMAVDVGWSERAAFVLPDCGAAGMDRGQTGSAGV